MTESPEYQGKPDVHGNRVIYEDMRHGSFEIYLHDLSTGEERRLTEDSAAQKDPELWRDLAVWVETSGDEHAVVVRDLDTRNETRIAGSGMAFAPETHRDTVTWYVEDRNGSYRVRYASLRTPSDSGEEGVPLPGWIGTAALALSALVAERRKKVDKRGPRPYQSVGWLSPPREHIHSLNLTICSKLAKLDHHLVLLSRYS